MDNAQVTQKDREALDTIKYCLRTANELRESSGDCNQTMQAIFWENKALDTLARHRLERSEPVAFQQGVDQWMDVCFGEAIKADRVERCDRFIEEALEFVQSVGYSAERAHALVDYVFNRDIGEVNQEVGGVMVTLAAACNTVGVDMQKAAETELARVWTKVEAIRAKQAAKPTGSALPVATTPPEPVAEIERLREALKRLSDERTLQTTIPEGPWTPEMVAEFQSKEVGHMRDLARAALGDAS